MEAFTEAVREQCRSEEVLRIGGGSLQRDVTALAPSEGHPLVFTRMFGAGRVHYNRKGTIRGQCAAAATAG